CESLYSRGWVQLSPSLKFSITCLVRGKTAPFTREKKKEAKKLSTTAPHKKHAHRALDPSPTPLFRYHNPTSNDASRPPRAFPSLSATRSCSIVGAHDIRFHTRARGTSPPRPAVS
ncbi:unnamed protein product, partial [Ectocarpus sp. 8 AP-2014]